MRLYQLFYVTALIASSVNLFGLPGVAIGGAIAAGWYYIGSGPVEKRRRAAFEVLVVAAILFLFTCCLFPSVSTARHAARRTQCNNNIKNIALALFSYESAWKKLPPAITYDANGRPMHSWRVLILPYLEEQLLYKKYSFDEPWDGPNNSKLLSQMPSVFRCPYLRDQPRTDFKTGYRVLISEKTCFPPNGSRKFDEIRDGLSNTLLVVESNQLVPWTSPSDPKVDEYFAEMNGWSRKNTPHHYSSLLQHCDVGGCFSMASGVTFHSNSITDKLLFEKLAYVNEGKLTESEFESLRNASRSTSIRWEGYLALAAFITFAVLPAFWLFKQKPNQG